MNSNNNKGDCTTLEESILLANEALEKAIETNDIENAIEMVEPYADKSLYHSSLKSLFIILNAGLTLKKEDLLRASESTAQTAKLSNKYRRTGFFNSLMKMFKTPNYDKYTDMELHAELTYAKFLALSALLCALDANNIYSLIRIAYRLRLCVYAFKECRVIHKTRTHWESETSRLHFEAGIRLAHGLQHLFISHIPPKLLRIVNFLGYKGVESVGFDELNKTAFELPGISSKLAQIILIFYWIVGQPHACLGPKDLTLGQQLIDRALERFPKSLLYRLAKGKLEQISGRIDNAIEIYSNCLLENPLEISHKVFHFELIFCFALKCQWNECIKYAELIRHNADHSPAIITYIEAIFRYAKSVDDCDPQMKQKASELFETIPSMRIRYFGKTITIEKISVENSKTYFKNNETLVLPEMGCLYHGNYLYFINNDKRLLNKHLQRVNKFVDYYEKDLEDLSANLDNYLSALFYKGVLLKHLAQFREAKHCLNIIMNEKGRIEDEVSIIPQTVLELGLIELAQHNCESAKIWLNKALKEYSEYPTENYVHLRAYAALRELGINTDKQNADKNKLNEYGKEWLKELEVEETCYEDLMKHDRLVLK